MFSADSRGQLARFWGAMVLALGVVLITALQAPAYVIEVAAAPPPNSGAPTGGSDTGGGSARFDNTSPTVTFNGSTTSGPTWTVPKQPTSGLEVDNMAFTTTNNVSFSFDRGFSVLISGNMPISVVGTESVGISGPGTVSETITLSIFANVQNITASSRVLIDSVSATASGTSATHSMSWSNSKSSALTAGSYVAEYMRNVIVPSGTTFADPGPFDAGFVDAVPEPATVLLLGIGGLILPAYRWRRRKLAA